MMRLLNRSSLRFYLRHPWQLGLALAGISLGVGVFVGVELANDSATRAFELSAALVRGQTSHRLLPVGADMDEAVYRELVVDRNIATAAPIVEADVGIAGHPTQRVPLLGVDPSEEGALRSFAAFSPRGDRNLIARLIAEPATVLLPTSLAEELGARPDSLLTLQIGGRESVVRVLGDLQMIGSIGDTAHLE